MSFRGLAQFDISQLPKVRTHAQLGRVGACTWYTPWDCTVSEEEQAAQEMVDVHNWLLDFGNIIANLKSEAIANNAPQSVIDGFADSLNKQVSLVQEHTAVMNEFYSKTGVSGLGKMNAHTSALGRLAALHQRLGVAWMVPATQLATYLGILARQLFWVWIVKIVGTAASAFKEHAEAAKTEAVARVDCYKLWRESKEMGTTPPNCAEGGKGTTDWTTIALVGGSVVLAVMLLSKK